MKCMFYFYYFSERSVIKLFVDPTQLDSIAADMKCIECSRPFKSKSAKLRHDRKIHNGVKCSRPFNTKSAKLCRDWKIHNGHETVPPIQPGQNAFDDLGSASSISGYEINVVSESHSLIQSDSKQSEESFSGNESDSGSAIANSSPIKSENYVQNVHHKFGNQSLVAKEAISTVAHIQPSQNAFDDWENDAFISEIDIAVDSERHSPSEESCSENESENKSDFDISSRQSKLVLDIGLEVDVELAKFLLPHQRDGVMFMWRICFGSIEKTKLGCASGCILSHCMGLGMYGIILT